MFSSKIEIGGSKEELDAYYNALHPEEENSSERASYKLKLQTNKLLIEISAQDATAFRALTNTLLGLISVVEKSIKAANK